MKKIAWITFGMIYFLGISAIASDVNSCVLKGKIVNTPKLIQGVWMFRFQAERSGKTKKTRADGSCETAGAPIEVSLDVYDEKKFPLKKGSTHWILDIKKQNNGKRAYHSYTLLTEAEAKTALEAKK